MRPIGLACFARGLGCLWLGPVVTRMRPLSKVTVAARDGGPGIHVDLDVELPDIPIPTLPNKGCDADVMVGETNVEEPFVLRFVGGRDLRNIECGILLAVVYMEASLVSTDHSARSCQERTIGHAVDVTLSAFWAVLSNGAENHHEIFHWSYFLRIPDT
ncbi:uncharacterized protein THITE_112906 [Thermothielavioides terrestris NRRL 8126]|uniref:Secreted protein n=1 Tax=Thermothielavioides terrestris (strain ATCC 38088 / NRRL 8126) TaxID=578455 RepID=G2QXT6_THETT|nr:uncharacterized protein THITE_112906 [Thermothielavioides terrestris NRRL 8126]AEO63204.1 hypothetical protein THITE_112906 [Thermothielavioides terrestris NRRL 8126]